MPRPSKPHMPRLRAEELEGRDVPATAFGLGFGPNANNLFRFDTATPATIQATIPITGLTAGDVVVGTDFRPADGLLYGVAASGVTPNTVTVYVISPVSGVATAVGAPVTLPAGNTITGATAWGVDFNPVADRIRVVNNLASDGVGGNANNFRLNPNDGTLAGGAVDTDLDFTALPVGSAPEVAVAYTPAQAGATTLFGIVSGTDLLVTNSNPNAGTLTPLAGGGALGVNTSDLAGLDVFGPSTAVAVLTVGGVPQLYTVNTTTGAATLVGTVGDGTLQLTDVSVAPPATPVVAGGTLNGAVQVLPAAGGQLTAGTSVTAFPNLGVNVRATTGDVNGDGTPDIIAVTGPGTAIRVTVISGVDNTTVLVPAFDPFGGDFTGGGFVTAANIDGAPGDEFVVTPDQGGGPRVTIFSFVNGALVTRANFFGIDDTSFRGGARAALGDVNGDSTPDLAVSAGFLGGPRTALFNGTTLLATPTRLVNDFFAFPGSDATTLRNGVFVTISDIDGDGFGDLVFGGGPGGAPRVFILSGQTVTTTGVDAAQAAPVANFFVANNSTDRGGVRVSAADLDGDARGDLVVGSGEGVAARVRAYRGVNFTTAGEPATFQDLNVFGGAVLAGGVFVG